MALTHGDLDSQASARAHAKPAHLLQCGDHAAIPTLRIAITLRSPLNAPKPTRSGRTGSAADPPRARSQIVPSIDLHRFGVNQLAGIPDAGYAGFEPPESVNLAGAARTVRSPVGWPSDAN